MNNKHVITGFAVMLLLYSAWRSWDYMVNNLEGVGVTTSWLVAFAFLFASEIGLLIWLHFARSKATTGIQETVSTVMIAVNFVGAMTLNLADLLVHNKLYNVDMSVIDPVLLLAPWILIAANVGGYIIYHMADSEEQLSKAERQLAHEEVKYEIDARMEAIKQLRQNRVATSEKLAPYYLRHIMDNVSGRTMNRFERQGKSAIPDVKITKDEKFLESGNGKADEPIEVSGNPTKR